MLVGGTNRKWSVVEVTWAGIQTSAVDDQSVSQSIFTITVVAAFNQEKALVVGAFSVIVNTDCETD